MNGNTWPTKYTLSLYEYRDHEIETMREAKKRQRRELIEAIVCTPFLIAFFILMLFV